MASWCPAAWQAPTLVGADPAAFLTATEAAAGQAEAVPEEGHTAAGAGAGPGTATAARWQERVSGAGRGAQPCGWGGSQGGHSHHHGLPLQTGQAAAQEEAVPGTASGQDREPDQQPRGHGRRAWAFARNLRASRVGLVLGSVNRSEVEGSAQASLVLGLSSPSTTLASSASWQAAGHTFECLLAGEGRGTGVVLTPAAPVGRAAT
jgi:hypothetical protein